MYKNIFIKKYWYIYFFKDIWSFYNIKAIEHSNDTNMMHYKKLWVKKINWLDSCFDPNTLIYYEYILEWKIGKCSLIN